MKLKKLRKHRRNSRWCEGLFSKNPVFVCGLAMPFAVMITTSLKNSVAVSILMACSLIPTVMLAQLIGKKIPPLVSYIVYALFSLAVTLAALPLVQPIAAGIVKELGIYVPILSVNSLLLTLCTRVEDNASKPLYALFDAVFYSLGFAFALCSIAFFRELIGNNTLWGNAIVFPFKAGGMRFALAGFIVAAFFSALFRFGKRTILLAYYRHENPLDEKEEDWV